ncbi:MAG: DUF3179 domain-containing protein, partial [Anaerolineae bacterium]|nr:DUF3179 domain-containing protein [Phycisphaerae bacterium]
MGLPILLILFATSAAAVVAYGVHPDLAQYSSGLMTIMIARRLMWPLISVSLILCIALIGLVITGKRRAWWLIGLAPVLALFVHRFQTDRVQSFAVIDNPSFADAADATFIADSDWVVGLTVGDTSFAYPYAALFRSPVVFQSEHERRIVLIWSPYANRVLA